MQSTMMSCYIGILRPEHDEAWSMQAVCEIYSVKAIVCDCTTCGAQLSIQWRAQPVHTDYMEQIPSEADQEIPILYGSQKFSTGSQDCTSEHFLCRKTPLSSVLTSTTTSRVRIFH
jgi:hypothetical protein